jgi:REP element-mobilizing transposase RayT
MKRIYISNAAYLVTTNPYGRIPYFQEQAFVDLFSYTIYECLELKDAILIGFKINPDHVHLLIQVREKFNISQVMHSIKRVSSDRINQILTFREKNSPYATLKWTPKLISIREAFYKQYPIDRPHEYAPFRWHTSFDDQLIRSKTHLESCINYLKIQDKKHGYENNMGLKITPEIPDNIRFLEK